jgi:hypothetical protein
LNFSLLPRVSEIGIRGDRLKRIITITGPRPQAQIDTVSKMLHFYIRRPFVNFVDSAYYSESELCGGVVTVSF